jgi:hypothetical protein
MPDNTQLGTPDPAGAIAATDEIGGIHFQRIKLIFGADGVNAGDVSDDNPLPVKWDLKSASFGAKQTSATGSTFVALDAAACISVEIKNTRPTVSGLAPADIEVRRGGTGATVCIPVGAADEFAGITNANQLQIRRYDQSNTQVTVDYEVRA